MGRKPTKWEKAATKCQAVVFGLIAQLTPGVTKPITVSHFHRAIKEIGDRHPKLLPMAFSSNTSDPFSNRLEQILFSMVQADCLSYTSRGCWVIESDLAEQFKGYFAPKLTAKDLAIIEEEGRRLDQRIRAGELSPRRL